MLRLRSIILLLSMFAFCRVDAQSSSDSIQVPNIFTPNYDGVNDVFVPIVKYAVGYDYYSIKIYDRFGLRVFEGSQLYEAWDGHTTAGLPCQQGFYFYTITTSFHGKEEKLSGFVYLAY